MIFELKQARQLIEANGWAGPDLEPMCGASRNRPCMATDEAVETFSVIDALRVAGAYPEGWYALEAVVCPAWHALDRFVETLDPATASLDQLIQFRRLSRAAGVEGHLQHWLKQPERTRADVLRAFVRAIARSKKTGDR